MSKLADGMTVQSLINSFGYRAHYAFCCRCRWQSTLRSFQSASKLAHEPDSHVCERPR